MPITEEMPLKIARPDQDATGVIAATREDFELLRQVIIEREREFNRAEHLYFLLRLLAVTLGGCLLYTTYQLTFTRITWEFGGLVIFSIFVLMLTCSWFLRKIRLQRLILAHVLTEMIAFARDTGYGLARNGHISELQWHLTKLDLSRFEIAYK
jgi:hypothetical protein